MKMTATEVAEQESLLLLASLAAAQQDFIKRWKPEDPYEAARFERDLYYLIGLAFREAQAPCLKQLNALAGFHLRGIELLKP
jgi:hypothetical protein